MIEKAIILAAGQGTRLREICPSKPLCPVQGRPLLEHAIYGLHAAGLQHVIVVTGYQAEAVEGYIAAGEWPIKVSTVRTADWTQPNGVSVLAARELCAGQPAIMAMCDHLVQPAHYARLAQMALEQGLCLGVDRRLGHEWIDPEDVTFVETQGDEIVQIGKAMASYNAYDTGVFAITTDFFDALASLEAPSITEGVRILAQDRRAITVDCSDLDWIDVDDPRALAIAERWLASSGPFLKN